MWISRKNHPHFPVINHFEAHSVFEENQFPKCDYEKSASSCRLFLYILHKNYFFSSFFLLFPTWNVSFNPRLGSKHFIYIVVYFVFGSRFVQVWSGVSMKNVDLIFPLSVDADVKKKKKKLKYVITSIKLWEKKSFYCRPRAR